MAGLTREQRAAKASAQQQDAPAAESTPTAAAHAGPNVLMERDGVEAEVANNESVVIMQALGWTLKEHS